MRGTEQARHAYQVAPVAEHSSVLVNCVTHLSLRISAVVRDHQTVDRETPTQAVASDEYVDTGPVLETLELAVGIDNGRDRIRERICKMLLQLGQRPELRGPCEFLVRLLKPPVGPVLFRLRGSTSHRLVELGDECLDDLRQVLVISPVARDMYQDGVRETHVLPAS